MNIHSSRKVWIPLKQRLSRIFDEVQGKERMHFIHIGKTGGTAIKHTIKNHSKCKNYTINLHPHEVHLDDVPLGEKIVFFLRDPISRFVSGFYSRQRQGQPRYLSPWNDRERTAFETYKNPNALALALSSQLEKERVNAQLAMKGIQHISEGYGKWLISEDYLDSRFADIVFIGFQECLSQDFDTLKRIIGMPVDVQLPIDNILAHKNPKIAHPPLDDESVINLRQWYREDFEFLALCTQLRKKIEHKLS